MMYSVLHLKLLLLLYIIGLAGDLSTSFCHYIEHNQLLYHTSAKNRHFLIFAYYIFNVSKTLLNLLEYKTLAWCTQLHRQASNH